MTEKDDDCVPCKQNAGAILALQICKYVTSDGVRTKEKIDCEKIADDVINGRISQEEVVDRMIENVLDEDVLEDLKEIKRLMLNEKEK